MKKLLALLFSLFFLSSPSVFAETVLYCQSELRTGIAFKEQTWQTGSFKSKRMTMKFNENYSELSISSSFDKLYCKKPYLNDSGTTDENLIYCASKTYNDELLRYSKKTKRFVHYFSPYNGYLDGGKDTDILTAGTCEKF